MARQSVPFCGAECESMVHVLWEYLTLAVINSCSALHMNRISHIINRRKIVCCSESSYKTSIVPQFMMWDMQSRVVGQM